MLSVHYIKAPVKGSTTNIATHDLTAKLTQIYVALQGIDEHTQSFCACAELKFTQTTFQCSDKRLKVFELLKTFCVLLGDTQSQLQQQSLDVIFHVIIKKKKKRKRWRWYLSRCIIMKNYPVPTCWRGLGWVATGELLLTEQRCSFFPLSR